MSVDLSIALGDFDAILFEPMATMRSLLDVMWTLLTVDGISRRMISVPAHMTATSPWYRLTRKSIHSISMR